MDGETRALLRSLDEQREHVLVVLDGLDEDALRSGVLPSGWTCLGLVQHLTLADERYWFRGIAAGEPIEFPSSHEGDAAEWVVEPGTSSEAVLGMYRSEIESANAIVAVTALDTPPRRRDPRWPDWEIPNMRWIILHMIVETARHVGHLDVARELLDGRTGLGQ